MAMASHLMIPHLVVQSKTRSNLRRLLMSVNHITDGGSDFILTPSNQRIKHAVEYKVVEEISLGDSWTYHLSPVSLDDSTLDWNQKVENLEVKLVSMGDEMGRFWESEDILSWSLTVKWKRP
jgi:hypothetical protein